MLLVVFGESLRAGLSMGVEEFLAALLPGGAVADFELAMKLNQQFGLATFLWTEASATDYDGTPWGSKHCESIAEQIALPPARSPFDDFEDDLEFYRHAKRQAGYADDLANRHRRNRRCRLTDRKRRPLYGVDRRSLLK